MLRAIAPIVSCALMIAVVACSKHDPVADDANNTAALPVSNDVANSAATLSLPESHFDAVRCGIALYGLSPFGRDPAEHGLEPVLSWRSYVAQAKTLTAGGSTGYGRRFVAERETRIGLGQHCLQRCDRCRVVAVGERQQSLAMGTQGRRRGVAGEPLIEHA